MRERFVLVAPSVGSMLVRKTSRIDSGRLGKFSGVVRSTLAIYICRGLKTCEAGIEPNSSEGKSVISRLSWLFSSWFRGTALSDSMPLASECRLFMLELELGVAVKYWGVRVLGASNIFLLLTWAVAVFLDVQAADVVLMSAPAAPMFAETTFAAIVGVLGLTIVLSVFFRVEPVGLGRSVFIVVFVDPGKAWNPD
jgi:hypothetical protein